MSASLLKNGYISKADLNLPSLKEMEKPVAVIECVQDIPCNPCEQSCPFNAIKIGKPITSLPILDAGKCKGCGTCIAKCPGLAIFVVHAPVDKEYGTVAMPYEYLPLPDIGDTVYGVDRKGEIIEKVQVKKVLQPSASDGTAVITIAVSKKNIHDIRMIRIIEEE